MHILLRDWNRRYYNVKRIDVTSSDYRRPVEQALAHYKDRILRYRNSTIEDFRAEDDDALVLFVRFDELLGPVGASKALHLLAPDFFTMWDEKIANLGNKLNTSHGWRLLIHDEKSAKAMYFRGS